MKKGLRIALLSVAVLILAGVVWALCFYQRINNPARLFAEPTAVPQKTAANTPEHTPVNATASPTVAPTAEPSAEPTPDAEEYLGAQADMSFMKDRVNVLALGIDESAERSGWGSYRTDTMMLITVDFTDNAVSLISVPRDSYVKIYNDQGEIAREEEPMAKINNAFAFGGGAKKDGFAYARTTVSKLLDVPVQHYVCVNMPVVKQLVDAMGGVEYEMDVEFTMNGRSYTTGMQHMNGQAVLDYCRLRKDSSDIVRVQRQQRMLGLILDTMKQSDQIRNIPAMYQAAVDHIETDMNLEQISALALLASRMELSALSSYTVPVQGVRIGERSCVGVRTAELGEMVKTVFHRKEIAIDPEIDAQALLNNPLPVFSDTLEEDGIVQMLNGIRYYKSGAYYFVLLPGANGYRGMTEKEFRALTAS